MGTRRGFGPIARAVVLLWVAALVSSTMPVSAESIPRPILSPPSPADAPVDVLAGPLFFLTDSVGLGAIEELAAASPMPFEHLGYPGITAKVAVELMNARTAPLGDVAVVALGYNYPYWDPAGFDADIDRLVERMQQLGANHIVWVTLRRADRSNTPRRSWGQLSSVAWYFQRVNDHIEAAVDRHPGLSVADWGEVSSVPGLTYDAIHLNPAGQQLMTQVVLDEVSRARQRSTAGTHAFSWPVDEQPPGAVVSVDVTQVRDQGRVSIHGCVAGSKQTSTGRLGRGEAATVLAAVPLGRKGRLCITATDAAKIVVRPVAAVVADGGLIIERNGLVPGYDIGLDPDAAALEPVRLFEPVEVSDVSLRPDRTRRLRVEARGRAPLFEVEVSSDTSGVVIMHECGAPKRRVPIVRFAPGSTAMTLVVGHVKNNTCLVTSAEARVVVRQVGTVKPSALASVRPRPLYSATAT